MSPTSSDMSRVAFKMFCFNQQKEDDLNNNVNSLVEYYNLILYSKSAEYALQAMIYLAENKSEKPVMVRIIAEENRVSRQFLAKITQSLVKYGLLKAVRGRAGGVYLAKDPKDIYLDQIIYAIDGPPPEKDRCIVGYDICSNDIPCLLHNKWEPIRNSIREMIKLESLADLANGVKEKRINMSK